jgi:hypothetical protein
MANPLERLVFDTGGLMAAHPPQWDHPNKGTVYEIACPSGSLHTGSLVYSRWEASPLPETVHLAETSRRVTVQENVYDYVPVLPGEDAVEWHVNFADPHLFVAYGSALFAQDEMQVAEHPALGALREALDAGRYATRTVEHGRPTPVLVMGVERRCRVATDRNPSEHRPEGLYGNAFARAGQEAIRRATHRIDPPTVTNLIAIAAPSGASGPYTRQTIEHILVTAVTGFHAAVLEAHRHRQRAVLVGVHTGFWGCGAFGGHRELMAMLQVVAAQMVGLERLVFHTVDASGTMALHAALDRIDHELAGQTLDMTELVRQIVAMGFRWGVSDGT